jgi:AbrB family looped-hinge helix DNA binding protein
MLSEIDCLNDYDRYCLWIDFLMGRLILLRLGWYLSNVENEVLWSLLKMKIIYAVTPYMEISMADYTTSISQNGRIVIPATIRVKLNLHSGDTLILRVEGDAACLLSQHLVLKSAQELVKSHAKEISLVKKLKRLRDEEQPHD